jgi:hypothetical protein
LLDHSDWLQFHTYLRSLLNWRCCKEETKENKAHPHRSETRGGFDYPPESPHETPLAKPGAIFASRACPSASIANSNPEMKVSWAESHGRKNIPKFEVCRGEGENVWMDDGLCNDFGFRSGHGPYGESHIPIGMVC